MRQTKTDDVVRVRATIDRGTVLVFTAQLEIYINGHYHPAERYDSAHGRAHRDTLDRSGYVVAKVWLPLTMDLNTAFPFGETDLMVNAATYRDAYLTRGGWK